MSSACNASICLPFSMNPCRESSVIVFVNSVCTTPGSILVTRMFFLTESSCLKPSENAVTAFSEGLRQELSVRKNIRITSIEPGVVQTELTNTITEKALEAFVEKHKEMEGLKAEDISNAIIFAIDAPNHVNVNEILVRPTAQEV